jgi:hypothetical protein
MPMGLVVVVGCACDGEDVAMACFAVDDPDGALATVLNVLVVEVNVLVGTIGVATVGSAATALLRPELLLLLVPAELR